MSDEYGVDLDEVFKVIDSADVLVVRFHLVERRLLFDFRTRPGVGPLAVMVARVDSIEERFRSVKKLRPEFGFPDKVMSFAWPRSVQVLISSGTWDQMVRRMVLLGGDAAEENCTRILKELEADERREVAGAIRGADHYQTLWERQRA